MPKQAPDLSVQTDAWEAVQSFEDLVRYAGDTLQNTAMASASEPPPPRACGRAARWLLGGVAESGKPLEEGRTLSLARELQLLSRACVSRS